MSAITGNVEGHETVASRRAVLAPEILRVRLVAADDIDTSIVEREFPTVHVERAASSGPGLVVDDFAWRGSFDMARFDEAIERARPMGLVSVRGQDAAGVACEVLARYQRFIARRNAASSTTLFDRVLELHRTAFDPRDPHALLELGHAIDTWQWMQRLDSDVGLAAQLAAIFHDIDRLEGQAHERIEHRVLEPSRGAKSGALAVLLLIEAGIAEPIASRVRRVMSTVERRAEDEECVLLDDADALSFLSLHSARYADHFGLTQTRRKVAFTVGRLSARARQKLKLIRLRPDVGRLLAETAA